MQPDSDWVQLSGPTPDALMTFVVSGQDDAQSELGHREKRRRLTTTSEFTVEAQNTSLYNTAEGFVTIFKRRLDIHFLDGRLCPKGLGNGRERHADRKLPVALLFYGDLKCGSEIRLKSTSGKLLVSSKIVGCSSQEILSDLQKACETGYGSHSRKREWSSSEVARSEFFLIPSQHSEQGLFSIEARVVWRITSSFSDLGLSVPSQAFAMLAKAFPPGEELSSSTSSPQLFYECVHTPERDAMTTTSSAEVEELKSQLYPFQRRAVRWLLRREGVDLDSNGKLCRYDPPPRSIPPSFRREVDVDGRECFVSHLYGAIATNIDGYAAHNEDFFGGILAEEMGLGKTVELIALMCLHKPNLVTRRPSPKIDAHSSLPAAKGTLIVTPQHILQQWITELEQHAPMLKVFHYEGIKGKTRGLEHDEIVKRLRQYDVVLTTYRVLTLEVHFTSAPSDRQLRHHKQHIPRRSPLVSILWWRVCLDEAQMVESGLTNAAKVARVIPRCNAWAVTGTPVRKDLKDLLGLLDFLHYEPYSQSASLWNRLLSSFPSTFRELFGEIALRHVKDQVRDELHIPPQKRVIITVPFTSVEEQHYSQLFQQMCDDCGVDRDGSPNVEDWDPGSWRTISKMRTWLTRLRQTCLHPQVGGQNRKNLGGTEGRPLRTVGEVLEVMIEQNDASMRSEERNQLAVKIRRGQLMENAHKPRQALDIWLDGLRQAREMVREFRLQLDQEILKVRTGLVELGSGPADGRKEGDVGEDGRITTCKQRLRAALELEHTCTFFIANAHYQIKSNEELTAAGSKEFEDLTKAETEYYEKARLIRRELLSEERGKAHKLMNTISQKAKEQDFTEIPEMTTVDQTGGLESRNLNEKLEVLTRVLNDQADQLDEWRETMIQLLIQRLVDEDEGVEIHGEEYDDSTKNQDDLYVYMAALRAVILDRHDALTGQNTYRTKAEVRHLKGLAEQGEGHNPELMLSVLSIREKLKPSEEMGSIRSILSELRTLATTLQFQIDKGNKRTAAELTLVEKQLEHTRTLSMNQAKALTGLERELDLFTNTQNARLEYYKQLQHISDTVASLNNEGRQDHDVMLEQLSRNESQSAAKVASLRAKARYLLHLRSETNNGDTGRICVICQGSFEIGALTVCGHQFCKFCIRLWWSQHRSCPVCKRHLQLHDLHAITYKPQEVSIQEEVDITKDKRDGSVKRSSLYSNVNSSTLNEIKNIDLDGSFGTKIDMLARHILWIRHNDPGAKSVVFSQYQDFLTVLAGAFSHFKIAAVDIDSKGGIQRFHQEPGMEVFLLHAKAQSSGLNLVNATHVFLCEPLINTAIELQAIARVHRIGQHRPTTVWMYLINDTVEESIYDISLSRRMGHIRRAGGDSQPSTEEAIREGEMIDAVSIDTANSLELQISSASSKLATKSQGGGEMVDNDDLWGCLFNKGENGHRSASKNGQDLLADDATGVPGSAGGVEPLEVQRQRRVLAAELRRFDNPET